ncbi:hypothetical protein EDD18DRAFT_1266866, partial [Armillaria luteobubalina]
MLNSHLYLPSDPFICGMVNTERTSLKKFVSELRDGGFLSINALWRSPGLEESPSMSLHQLQLLISRCIHFERPVKSLRDIASNEKMVDYGAENRERNTLSVPALNAGLVVALMWKLSFMGKALALNQMLPYRSVAPLINESRLYAVLIGIDAYESYPLRGCVSDALSVRKYLIDDLHVPKERIRCLFGTGSDCQVTSSEIPSRKNIIATLLGLVQDPHIYPGDGIIIYFSGHGTSYQLPERACLKSLCPIEALCPIDRDTRDNDNMPFPDISDREFNAILTHIYQAKGNRITVILDC